MKAFWWYKITANVLSFDNANYVVTNDPTTFDSPKTVVKYTGSVNFSLNYFEGFADHWNFYLSGNVQLGLKDMFSGIYTPATYNGFSRLTDTSLIQKTNEQIFETTNENVSMKILPDFGSELIVLRTCNTVGLGIDLGYTNNFVISNKPGISTGNISTVNVGFIVGLQDKTGKSNINIEPYFQYQDFIKVAVASQHLYGVKFSIPINSLF